MEKISFGKYHQGQKGVGAEHGGDLAKNDPTRYHITYERGGNES